MGKEAFREEGCWQSHMPDTDVPFLTDHVYRVLSNFSDHPDGRRENFFHSGNASCPVRKIKSARRGKTGYATSPPAARPSILSILFREVLLSR